MKAKGIHPLAPAFPGPMPAKAKGQGKSAGKDGSPAGSTKGDGKGDGIGKKGRSQSPAPKIGKDKPVNERLVFAGFSTMTRMGV